MIYHCTQNISGKYSVAIQPTAYLSLLVMGTVLESHVGSRHLVVAIIFTSIGRFDP